MQRGSKRQIASDRADERHRRMPATQAPGPAYGLPTGQVSRITPANDPEPAVARRRPRLLRRNTGLLGAVLGFSAAFLSVLAGGLLLASHWPRRAPTADLVSPLPERPATVADAAAADPEVYVFRMEPDDLDLPPSEPIQTTASVATPEPIETTASVSMPEPIETPASLPTPARIAIADEGPVRRIVVVPPPSPPEPVAVAIAVVETVVDPVIPDVPTLVPVPRLTAAAQAVGTAASGEELASHARIGRRATTTRKLSENARAAAITLARAVPEAAAAASPPSVAPLPDGPAVATAPPVAPAMPGAVAEDVATPPPPVRTPRTILPEVAARKPAATPARRNKIKVPPKRVAVRKAAPPVAAAPETDRATQRHER